MKLLYLIAVLFSVAPGNSVSQPSTLDELMIVAHRGAPRLAPENTIASFRKAMEIGVTALELDVHQTADSALVVVHDDDVDRTTNGNGDISDLTLSQLKELDAGGWFGVAFRDERIPTLEEVFALKDSVVQFIVELKGGSDDYPRIEERVVQLIHKQKLRGRVILKSFDRSVLQRIRALDRSIPLLYVYVVAIPWINVTIDKGVSGGDIFALDVEYLQPHRLLLTESFVKDAHDRGFKVIAWDIHSELSMREAITLGVDGIETDAPDLLRTVIRDLQSESR